MLEQLAVERYDIADVDVIARVRAIAEYRWLMATKKLGCTDSHQISFTIDALSRTKHIPIAQHHCVECWMQRCIHHHKLLGGKL
jgi:hypothetical protein